MYMIIVFVLSRLFWALGLLIKNFGIFTGIVKQIIKLLAGFASLTPSREDDILVTAIDDLFNSWQDRIYAVAVKIYDWYSGWQNIISWGD